MPQRKSASSLYQVCLKNISKNVKYWTKLYEQIYWQRSERDKAKIKYVIGPFDDFNSSVAEDLLDMLVSSKKLTQPALHLIVNGGAITKVNLQDCPKMVNDDLVLALARRCPKIRYLNLRKCQRVTAVSFLTLSESLPNAVSLNFSLTNIRSLAIHKLFDFCPHLQELLLQSCQINDQDLHVLCQLACKKGPLRLRHIDLTGSMVTEDGVKEVLYYLPYLCEVEFGSLLSALHGASVFNPVVSPEMEVRTLDTGHRFSIQALNCSDFMSISDDGLELIVKSCPNVTKVDLRFAIGLTAPGLLQLMKLENLRELRLGVDGSRSISYESGLRPLLEVRGSNLLTLTLQDFHGINIVEILHFCPNLRKCIIFMIEFGSLFEDFLPRPDINPIALQELHIWSKLSDRTLTEGVLEAVLSKAQNLETLGLIRVESFTDNLVSRVLEQNQLSQLCNFSLNECNNVSGQALTSLILNDRNALKDVKLMNNWQITLQDYENWESVCVNRNYDISLSWT